MPLFGGLFVQAKIEGVTREKLFVLPLASIGNLRQVKLVNADRRLELRRVEVLRSQGDNSIVSAGLAAGERVVVSELPRWPACKCKLPTTGAVGCGMTSANPEKPFPGVLAWFAGNPVAANLLMLLILAGGIVGLSGVDKEVFPRFSPHQIEVKAEFPGA